MYWFKKIIRAILNLLPVFVLSLLFTNNTFAYKYSPIVLPNNFAIPNSYGGPTSEYGFSFVVSNDIDYHSYLARPNLSFYSYGSFPTLCSDTSELTQFPLLQSSSYTDRYNIYYGFYGTTPNQPLPSSWNLSNCLDSSSRIDYTGFYASDSDTTNGLFAETKLDLSSIFGVDNYPNKIYSVTYPLGSLSQSSLDNLSSNSTFDFSGEFVADFDDPSNSGLTSNTSVSLHYYYVWSDGTYGTSSLPCSVNVGRDDPNDLNSVWSILYNCHYQADSRNLNNDPLLYFSISVNPDYSSNSTKLFQFIYDSNTIITDGNDSPAPDSWGDQHVYGTNPDQSPGSAKQVLFPDIKSDGFNWSQSLIQLFGFTFLNPFAPLFEMFSNNDSCAQIPTLAGLIHSESTEVCPWFSSSVRNIATPVLTISSMMLIFGFTVRWLGSRSGNFIEDSGGVESGGYSFANKFRRKG